MALVLAGCAREADDGDIVSVTVVTPAPDGIRNSADLQNSSSSVSDQLAASNVTFEPINIATVDEYVRCDSEVVPIPVSVFWDSDEYTATLDGRVVMSSSFMVPFVNANLAVQDPYYTGIVSALATLRSDLAASAVQTVSMGLEYASELYSVQGSDFEPYYDTTEMTVNRADSTVVSFLAHNEYYFGGVHPNYSYWGYNYDTASGRELTLLGILSEAASKNNYRKLTDAIETEVCAKTSQPEILDFSVLPDMIATDGLPFTIDYQGITVYINPYVIGPYAAGYFEVHLSFKKYGDLFTDAYRKVPASYMLATNGYQYAYDVDSDGEYEDMHAPESNALAVTSMVMVHNTDGKNYLYMYYAEEGFAGMNHVYEITGEQEYTYVASVDGVFLPVVNYGAKAACTVADPQDLWIEAGHCVLGVTFEKAAYHINEDGVPVRHSRYFIVSYPSEEDITLKQDMIFQLVDSETDMPVENVLLPQGSVLHLYRTDCNGVVDFRAENDKIYRIRTAGLEPYGSFDGLN